MIKFLKMNGLGNDFVILDRRKDESAALAQTLVRQIANRQTGPGCDQLLILASPAGAGHVAMIIYNADGSRARACGNGARCVARLLMEEESRETLCLETEGGMLACARAGDQVRVDLNAPRFGWKEIPLAGPDNDNDTLHVRLDDLPDAPGDFTAVSIGNPHAVFFLDPGQDVRLEKIGPPIARHPIFPEGVNLSFVHVEAPDRLRVRVWERGAGATLACGTAAAASLAAASRRGLATRAARVHLPGGALFIEWRGQDDHLLMTGPAAFEYAGEMEIHRQALTGWRRISDRAAS